MGKAFSSINIEERHYNLIKYAENHLLIKVSTKAFLHDVHFITCLNTTLKREGQATSFFDSHSEDFRLVVKMIHILLLSVTSYLYTNKIVHIDIHIYIRKDVIWFVMSDLTLKNSVNLMISASSDKYLYEYRNSAKKFCKNLNYFIRNPYNKSNSVKIVHFLSINCVNFLNCIDVGDDNLYTVYIQLFFGGIHSIKKVRI